MMYSVMPWPRCRPPRRFRFICASVDGKQCADAPRERQFANAETDELVSSHKPQNFALPTAPGMAIGRKLTLYAPEPGGDDRRPSLKRGGRVASC